MNIDRGIIQYGRQWIDKRDITEVAKILGSDFLTQGPTIEKFERKVATYCGVRFAVAFSSGTAALHGACFAAGISSGDEVITTPLTFAASANCILYCGGRPVFADIERKTGLIDPLQIEKKITQRTKAIIPVDYAGQPTNYDEIKKIAKKNNLIIIADAAHSFGAKYKGRKVGSLVDMTVFSFHPIKTITTGEGGMVLTDNKNFIERLRIFRTHGITKDRKDFVDVDQGPWYYEMQELGFNYRLTDIQAALGITQLKRIDEFLKRRKAIAQKYTTNFKHFPNIQLLQISTDCACAWHLYPILLKDKLIKKKKEIVNAFEQNRIITQVHYMPVHLHPYYRKRYGFKNGDYPKSEDFYLRELSIPIYPRMADSEVQKVIDVTYSIISKYR